MYKNILIIVLLIWSDVKHVPASFFVVLGPKANPFPSDWLIEMFQDQSMMIQEHV